MTSNLLAALDLACQTCPDNSGFSNCGRPTTRGPDLLLPSFVDRVTCPNCDLLFARQGRAWCTDSRWAGRGRYVCYTLEKTTSRLCVTCDRLVAEEHVVQHNAACLPARPAEKNEISETRAAAALTAPRARIPPSNEQSALGAMLEYWEAALGYPTTGACAKEVEKALVLRHKPGGHCRFSLCQLLTLGSRATPFYYPPRISEVVQECRTLPEAQRLRETYHRILLWLRAILLESVRSLRLGKEEYCRRATTLQEIITQAVSAALVQQANGRFGAKGPELEQILFQYVRSPSRLHLLSRLGALSTRWVGSFLLLDGTDALKPAFIRHILGLETYIRRGATMEAVCKTTLDEYLAKQRLPGSDLFQWHVAAAAGETLVVDQRLARAIDGYVSHVRHRHCPGTARLKNVALFPTSKGTGMANLLNSMEVLFKLAGGRPEEVEIRAGTLDILKEVMVEHAESPKKK